MHKSAWQKARILSTFGIGSPKLGGEMTLFLTFHSLVWKGLFTLGWESEQFRQRSFQAHKIPNVHSQIFEGPVQSFLVSLGSVLICVSPPVRQEPMNAHQHVTGMLRNQKSLSL